ncbi:MAG: hypothetical protein GF393_11480 [Armatimonadia bacterium]|nr:hypothetical protein [Armatimonadia bacterium]
MPMPGYEVMARVVETLAGPAATTESAPTNAQASVLGGLGGALESGGDAIGAEDEDRPTGYTDAGADQSSALGLLDAIKDATGN